jgi:hypothetical protein
MSRSPRADSPILPSFPRKLSEPKFTLACVAEQPQQPHDLLPSPSVSSHASLSPPLPHEKFPSCLSISNLGQENEDEDEDAENWNEGWDICSVDEMGEVSLLQDYTLPIISEGAFMYHPGLARVPVVNHESENDEAKEKSVKLARRKLVRRERKGVRVLRPGKWLKKVARKFGKRAKVTM